MLRAKDFSFMIEDSRCSAVVYSPEFQSEVEPALELLSVKPKIVLLSEGESESFRERIKSADLKT